MNPVPITAETVIKAAEISGWEQVFNEKWGI